MSKAVLSRDTTAAAERVQVETWRSMSPAEKLELTRSLSRQAVDLARAGLERRYPAADRRELDLRLAKILLGEALVRAAYPDAEEYLAP